MSLRLYLFIMILATLVCWLSFGFILWTVNPLTTNFMGFLLFYLALFFSLIGTASIVGFLTRFVFLRHELAAESVKVAFRQSFMFAALITVSLFLSARGLLSWLNLLVLIVGLSALEFFLLTYEKNLATADKTADNNQYDREIE